VGQEVQGIQNVRTDATTDVQVAVYDSAGVNALSINGSGQALAQVSGNTAANAVGNPIFVELSNGTNAIDATHPLASRISADGTNYVDATHGLYSNLLQGNAVLSATNGVYTNILSGNAVLSASNALASRISADGSNYVDATHGLYSNLLQGNAVLSATNGLYSNLLQGNAILSATNGLFSNVLQGNAVLSATNGLYSNILQGNAALSASNPLPDRISADGTNFVSVSHPLFVELSDGTNPLGTSGNPIIVTFTETGTGGTQVFKYHKGDGSNVNLAANGGTYNYDYTVTTGKTLSFRKLVVTAPDYAHVDLIYDPSGTNVTYATLFVGPGCTTVEIDFNDELPQFAATKVVRCTLTNDAKSQTNPVTVTWFGMEA
jgi:hypothetical protein